MNLIQVCSKVRLDADDGESRALFGKVSALDTDALVCPAELVMITVRQAEFPDGRGHPHRGLGGALKRFSSHRTCKF